MHALAEHVLEIEGLHQHDSRDGDRCREQEPQASQHHPERELRHQQQRRWERDGASLHRVVPSLDSNAIFTGENPAVE